VFETRDHTSRPDRERDRHVVLEDVAAVEMAVVADDHPRPALDDRAVARPIVLDVDASQAGSTSTRVSL
jgi:hypothetical protein